MGKKKSQENTFAMRLLDNVNTLLVSIPFFSTWIYFCLENEINRSIRLRSVLALIIFVLSYLQLVRTYGGFDVATKRRTDLVYAQVLSAFFTDAMMYIVFWILLGRFPAVWLWVLQFIVQIVIIILWAIYAQYYYVMHYPAKKTVVIYDEFKGIEDLIKRHGMDGRYKVIGVMSVKQFHGEGWKELSKEEKKQREAERLHEVLSDADAVFLCCVHSHFRNQVIKYCVANNIWSYTIPRIGDVIMSGAEPVHLFHLPMLSLGRYNPSPEYLAVKRAFDVVMSLIALIVFSPLMIVLALIIRSDGGTAFYRQKRLTKDGKVFEILKFRSMRMDAEKDGVARLSSGENDPRITKVGRFIRACRFDELPQLINILKGDMSIVGPRPERPEIAEEYRKVLPEFDLRLQCKCGLTGYAQVCGQYNTTPYNKLLLDLMYIANASVMFDLSLCFATVQILFMKDSTEGIAADQTTASMEIYSEDDEEAEDA